MLMPKYWNTLALTMMLLGSGAMAAQDAGDHPDPLLNRLGLHLKAVLADGCLPPIPELNKSQRASFLDNRHGMKHDFAEWSRFCISYHRKVENQFAYRPLTIVQTLRERPLDIPWRTEQWARKIAEDPDPFGKTLKLLAEFPDAAERAVPIARSGAAGPYTLEALHQDFVRTAAMVDKKALKTIDREERKLLQFVVPWICRTAGRFVNRSKGSPYYGFYWSFNPEDPFKPGDTQTSGGNVRVPHALYSMTGLYHYLRALAGQPVETTGIRQDYVKDQTFDHPRFKHRVDYQAMEQAFATLATALSKEHLDCLKESLTPMAPTLNLPRVAGVSGIILQVIATPYGRIVVGGNGANQYVDVDAAVILDLGGNDTYTFHHPEQHLGEKPVQLIVDFEGDDVYRTDGVGGPGAGILGISILIDRAGNDRYCQGLAPQFQPRAHTRADLMQDDPDGTKTHLVPYVQLYGNPRQPDSPGVTLDHGFAYGAGFLGIGLLIDEAGDDLYLGQKYVFGTGYWHGVGVLYDMAGNDVYAAGIAAMGAGINEGLGVLDDRHGDDHYQCLGLHEVGASAGQEWDNGYEGGGIGYGSSWRGEARGDEPERRWQATFGGGVGLVHDGGGNDEYISGVMSLACGYSGGIGIIIDDAGNDVYFAKRGPGGDNHSGQSGNYSLGHGCHRGIGYLLDRTGNDRYSGGGSFGGWSWDIAGGFLFDLGGDDQFTDFYGKGAKGRIGPGMAQGLGVSFNYGGKDTYHCYSFGSAEWLAKGYPGVGGNFSFFYDVGPELDDYPTPYTNNVTRVIGVQFKPEGSAVKYPQGIGLFMDGKHVLECPRQ